MKYLRWMIIILGISFVSLLSIASRVDAPETAYNQTDAPVDFVARTNFVMPTGHFVAIPRKQQVRCEPATAIRAATLKPGMRISHSLLNLLCTLLC
jgi:hypothetical protein